jgi:integrase
MKGTTYKRCGCRDQGGRRMNQSCPKLRSRNHGAWYYTIDLPPGTDGERRRRRCGGFATQRDAETALALVVERLQRRVPMNAGRQTVAEYLELWLAGKLKLRVTTRRCYRQHLEQYLIPALGSWRLEDLTTEAVERCYADIRAGNTQRRRPVNPTTLRRIHATLMSALNTAVKRRLIPINPAAFVELESAGRPRAVVWTDEKVAAWRAGAPRPAVAVWTPEQTGRFLDTASDDRLYALYHLIVFRGLRRGEAVGLPWYDVDLERLRLIVSQQIVQVGWATAKGAPKTDSGARIVALDTATVAVLRAHRAR